MSGKKIIEGLEDVAAGRVTVSAPAPRDVEPMSDAELEAARLNAEAMDDQRALRVCDELIQVRKYQSIKTEGVYEDGRCVGQRLLTKLPPSGAK